MLTLAKYSIPLYDAGNSVRKMQYGLGTMKSLDTQKCCFLLLRFAIKTCNIKTNTTLWAWRNRAKLKFLSDIHWFNTTQYFIEKMTIFWHTSTKLNCLSCLAGLLSGPCSFLLLDVQTWVRTVYAQDLKPTVLPQYIPICR